MWFDSWNCLNVKKLLLVLDTHTTHTLDTGSNWTILMHFGCEQQRREKVHLSITSFITWNTIKYRINEFMLWLYGRRERSSNKFLHHFYFSFVRILVIPPLWHLNCSMRTLKSLRTFHSKQYCVIFPRYFLLHFNTSPFIPSTVHKILLYSSECR